MVNVNARVGSLTITILVNSACLDALPVQIDSHVRPVMHQPISRKLMIVADAPMASMLKIESASVVPQSFMVVKNVLLTNVSLAREICH